MDLIQYQTVVGSTAAEFADTGLEQGMLFPWQIKKQNEMYELPVNQYPTLDGLNESPVKRMQGFMKTLKKEMDEGIEILALFRFREWLVNSVGAEFSGVVVNDYLVEDGVDAKRREKIIEEMVAAFDKDGMAEVDKYLLVTLSDWLGDMQVYNRSEAMKYGIPLESVLACIMGSNFTKLGEDGLPIKDANGKFLKGPNFEAPEAYIYATLFEAEQLSSEFTEMVQYQAELTAIAIPSLAESTLFDSPDWEQLEEPEVELDDEAASDEEVKGDGSDAPRV